MEAESLNQEKPKSPDGKKEKKKMHKVDHLTEIIGVFGRFHGLVYTIIGITISMHAWQMMSNKFFTRKTESWCARPDSLSGIPIDLWLNLSAPIKNNESGEFDRCRIFNVDYLNLNRRPSENTPTIPCEAWEYADRPFDVSLTTCSISRVFTSPHLLVEYDHQEVGYGVREFRQFPEIRPDRFFRRKHGGSALNRTV